MYCIAIDLGGTFIKIGLIKDSSILESKFISANNKCFVDNLNSIEFVISSLLKKWNVTNNSILGVGLAFPGMVDPYEKNVVSTNDKYNDAIDFDFSTWVYDNWRTSFIIDNDARLALVGEWQFGAGKYSSNMVMMTIGTGIGTGVVLDGRLIEGRHYHAGSLGGHMIVDYNGRRCTCGNNGCVEAMASSFFLSSIINSNTKISYEFRQKSSELDFKNLFTLMRQGCSDAAVICNECMDVWAAAIINYIYAYDPELIVLGGGVMCSSDIIIPYIKNKIENLVWTCGEKVKIVPSKLSDNAALLGIYYILNSTRNDETLF